jgi:hypothetical protein
MLLLWRGCRPRRAYHPVTPLPARFCPKLAMTLFVRAIQRKQKTLINR